MDENSTCGRCGQPAAAEARFCTRCGERLASEPSGETTQLYLGSRSHPWSVPLLDAAEAAAVAALPAGSAFLLCHRGPRAGSRYLLDQDHITIGRHPDNDICLEDITVSRRHLEFRREAHRYFVHDLASLNGTYLNGARVDLAAVSDGDEIRVGKFRLLFAASPARPV